jgi:uncharacterized protein YutE (UPF0331/DUF86 family)
MGETRMSPGKISEKVVTDRLSWIEEMLGGIRALPLADLNAFVQDPRNVAAAESYLRRSLEALLDMGRHILAKAFGMAVSEYKSIPQGLREAGILSEEETRLLRDMAGYRNRLVHFYDQVSTEELYTICAERAGDVLQIAYCLRDWVASHPELVDRAL